MNELKPLLHMVSFSGGKDSTAMLLKMLEMGMQVDLVLFCDTGLEFPALYDHVHKVEQDTGVKVTTVKSEYTFEYLMLHKTIKRKKPDLRGKTGYSWAGPLMRWCTNLLKTVPREKFLSELRKKYDVIEYIGIAADETERITHKCNSRPNVRLPLVEWGMTEADCLKYCKERGYDWGGLYEKFGRVSCWCCPLQPLNELRVLYYDFPDLWKSLGTRRDCARSVRCTISPDFPRHVWYIYFAKRRGLFLEKTVICNYRKRSGIKQKERIYMKILVCEPGKHPYVKDIEHTLSNLQKEVGGYIQALYPFEEEVAVVCNEEGLFVEGLEWNRTVEKYGPIKGTFFVCGLGIEDFCGLTDAQIEKYKKVFWNPEIFIPTQNDMVVLHIVE